MQWVNLSLRDLRQGHGRTASRRRARATRSSRASASAARSNSGDPVTIYDQYAGRWVASQFGPIGSLRTTSALPSRTRTTRPAPGARTGSTSTTRSSTTTRRWACGRAQNAYTMTANQFPRLGLRRRRRVGARARPDDRSAIARLRACVYQDMDRDRAVPGDAHAGRRGRRHPASGQRTCAARLDQPGRVGPSQ